MKFTIITLNDDRIAYKTAIRETIGVDEIELPAVDGRAVDLDEEIAKRGLKRRGWGNAKQGELGVWLSNFDRWEYAASMDEPLIVFEDDAILDPMFNTKVSDLLLEMPEDWDIAALWVPENQRQDYYYDVAYDELGIPRISGYLPADQSYYRMDGRIYTALVYQGYGMVSLMYSPRGGKKLVDLARSYDITNPVDCWIYEQAHMGNLKGYAPRPEHATIVHYDWAAESHVQLTERA